MINRKIRLFPLFLIIAICICFFTGCADNDTLPANQWLSIDEAEGNLYDAISNKDKEVDAEDLGFSIDKISNDKEWDTPSLRYNTIFFDVKESCNIVGLAFELKTDALEGFNIKVEAQLYKELSFPSNWKELTDEAKMIWEKENRIKDKQFDTVFVNKMANAVSFSFNTEGLTIDDSYQIRLYFSTQEQEELEVGESRTDYLKNFMVDNFIVLIDSGE